MRNHPGLKLASSPPFYCILYMAGSSKTQRVRDSVQLRLLIISTDATITAEIADSHDTLRPPCVKYPRANFQVGLHVLPKDDCDFTSREDDEFGRLGAEEEADGSLLDLDACKDRRVALLLGNSVSTRLRNPGTGTLWRSPIK